MDKRTCSLPNCDNPLAARGWCMSHYNRWHYHGDPLASAAEVEACAQCGLPVPPKGGTGPRALYCSKSCRSRASYERRKGAIAAKQREARRELRVLKRCPCCGESFKPEATSRQVFCSRTCSKRMQNAGRRAKVRESFVEALHWRMLYDEDGPECHICGYDTDPNDFEVTAAGRTYGLGYPTLDHVLALALGGRHERSNARLAHLYCNSVKGARVLDVAS